MAITIANVIDRPFFFRITFIDTADSDCKDKFKSVLDPRVIVPFAHDATTDTI